MLVLIVQDAIVTANVKLMTRRKLSRQRIFDMSILEDMQAVKDLADDTLELETAKTTNMHPNSLKAHKEEKVKLGKRADLIYAFLMGQPRPMTDRQIQAAMFNESGVALCQPRITELIDKGWLKETGKTLSTTGKDVRLVRAMSGAERTLSLAYKQEPLI